MSVLITAWQRALAAEQQAAFGYALLGPQLPAGLQDAARSSQTVHEDLRDRTTSTVAALGVVPVAPLGDYPGLYPLSARPARLAATLEHECAEAWRSLYAAAAAATASATAAAARSTASARSTAQRELTASAVRATQWRIRAHVSPAVVPFPGI